VSEEHTKKRDAINAAKFKRRAKELEGYAWERGGILIRPVRSETEMRAEGKSNINCVATYAQSHIDGTTAILVIRRAGKPKTPWYTLELNEKELTVRQNCGKRNCERTDEIREFEKAWLAEMRARRETANVKPGRAKKIKEDKIA
jgi:hypothetical protein